MNAEQYFYELRANSSTPEGYYRYLDNAIKALERKYSELSKRMICHWDSHEHWSFHFVSNQWKTEGAKVTWGINKVPFEDAGSQDALTALREDARKRKLNSEVAAAMGVLHRLIRGSGTYSAKQHSRTMLKMLRDWRSKKYGDASLEVCAQAKYDVGCAGATTGCDFCKIQSKTLRGLSDEAFARLVEIYQERVQKSKGTTPSPTREARELAEHYRDELKKLTDDRHELMDKIDVAMRKMRMPWEDQR